MPENPVLKKEIISVQLKIQNLTKLCENLEKKMQFKIKKSFRVINSEYQLNEEYLFQITLKM